MQGEAYVDPDGDLIKVNWSDVAHITIRDRLHPFTKWKIKMYLAYDPDPWVWKRWKRRDAENVRASLKAEYFRRTQKDD